MITERLLEAPFSLTRAEKLPALLELLNGLTQRHGARCEAYGRILDAFGWRQEAADIESLPFIPVRLFKEFDLRSIPQEETLRILTSSGTTGQAVSRIVLDSVTAQLQAKALVRIVNEFLGRTRRPMVIVDTKSIAKSGSSFGARAAAILGFSSFGREHLWLLDEQFKPDWDALQAYLEKHRGHGVLIFGFTFMIWQHLLLAARRDGVSLDFGAESYLVHGGGWKKLLELSVDDLTFRRRLSEELGVGAVSDYYGMVEQTGSIFMQCHEGVLHTPSFADVIVRDPQTLLPLSVGSPGVIQVISVLPLSYPGHSLLTEDIGVVHGEDDCPCGRRGRYLTIKGRLPKAEARGCSDVARSTV